MNESLTYQAPGAGVSTRDRTHTLFAQTMGYVVVTASLFALGAYLGRNLAGAVGGAQVGAASSRAARRVRPADRAGRGAGDISSAPLLAASIFLDILNVFLFFLQIFSSQEQS